MRDFREVIAVGGLRAAPEWFRSELVRRFGTGHDCVWDDQIQRWVILSPSASGRPTRQAWVWYKDPRTGQPLKPDKSGILPARELDQASCYEILDNMEKSALTARDGPGSWARKVDEGQRFNDAVTDTAKKEAVNAYVDALTEADLRRPWVKHHSRSAVQRQIAQRGR